MGGTLGSFCRPGDRVSNVGGRMFGVEERYRYDLAAYAVARYEACIASAICYILK